jgi:hypothetical protein
MNEMEERGMNAILDKVPIGYGMTKMEAFEYARAVIRVTQVPTPEPLEAAEIVDRVMRAIIRAIIDVGFTDDARMLPVARAAIKEMHKPTPEMIDAMKNLMRGVIDYRESAIKVWEAGVRTALAGNGTGT